MPLPEDENEWKKLFVVFATAKGDIKRINIDDSLLKKEEKEMMEDLIIAAINDAKQKGEAASQEEMKSVTGGMPLPPGMKLPFSRNCWDMSSGLNTTVVQK